MDSFNSIETIADNATVLQGSFIPRDFDNTFSICIKWNGQEINVVLQPTATVLELKNMLYEKTAVLPQRQRLLGGKAMSDEKTLSEVFKPHQKIMMMGTPEEVLASILVEQEDDGTVFNDFELTEETRVPYFSRPELLERVENRVREYEIHVFEWFREGKKLLVLDIDYTIFDMKSVGQNGRELMRPYLHEFLHVAYRNYDIIFWSATSMKWIIAKMEELGIKANFQAGYYKISALLDSNAMISITTSSSRTFKTKPLGVLWGKFPQFSEKNSLMVDDLNHNFAMNPKCGLKISPYRNAFQNRDKDTELIQLAEYLEAIADQEDFTKLNHKRWAHVAQEHRRKLRRSERDERKNNTGPGSSSAPDRQPDNNDP